LRPVSSTGTANFLATVALWAFLPVTLVCLLVLGPRRGLLAALFGGWLLLPTFGSKLDFPLLHNKAQFVPTVILCLSLLLDSGRWRRVGWHLVDLPAALLVAGPFATALANDMALYEAGSAALAGFTTWAGPYLLGRVYFGRGQTAAQLASAMVVGGLIYVPFCLWEMRMSPNLQYSVYGFGTFAFEQSRRFGGYRPAVFLGHGLPLAMFMAAAALVAYWLWRSRARTEFGRVPAAWVAGILVATAVMCRSAGAAILLAMGIGVLEASRWIRSSALTLALLLVPPTYCAARVAGWGGAELVGLTARVVNEERAQSLAFRIRNENLLMEKAMQRPVLGWGRWGRFFVYDEEGRDISIPDGLWIINLGSAGVLGLASLSLLLALPVILLLRRFPARHWGNPRLAPAAALAAAVMLWVVDEVLNAFASPVFVVMAGALASFALGGLRDPPLRSRVSGASRVAVPARPAPPHLATRRLRSALP